MSKLVLNLPKPNQGIIGHRGAAGLAPENTLIAFKKANELNLNWVEFDIQCCLEGEWVVFHDETLNRTTNEDGLVSKTPLSLIQQLDAGAWFSPLYTSTRIPLLKEALDTVQFLKLHPNIEIKSFNSDSSNKVTKMQSLLKNLEAFWPAALPLPLISSFDLELLEILRSLNSRLPLGYNTEGNLKEAISSAIRLQLDSIHISMANATPNNIQAVLNNNLPLLIFTLNDPLQIQNVLTQGAFSVFSDLTYYGPSSP